MRNYFLILLSVMGMGILVDNIRESTSVAASMANTTSSEIAELASFEEPPTLSKISEITTTPVEEITTTAQITTPVTRKVVYTTSAATSSASSITSVPSYVVTTYTDTIQSRNLSSTAIYKTKKLIYGHNSANLLGSLKNLAAGSAFTISEDGATSTYQVANVQIFEKSSDYTLELCTSGYENCTGGTYYLNTLQNATFRGKSYDVALFTCDGTSLGNGDATHRRVVFANKI